MPIVVLARRRSRRKVRTPDSALQRPSLIGVAAEHANQSNVDLLAFQPSFVRLGGSWEGAFGYGAEQLARRRFSEPGVSVSVPFLIA